MDHWVTDMRDSPAKKMLAEAVKLCALKMPMLQRQDPLAGIF